MNSSDRHAKDFGKKGFMIVLAVVLVIFAIVGGIIFFIMSDMSRPSQGTGTSTPGEPSNAGKTEIDRQLR